MKLYKTNTTESYRFGYHGKACPPEWNEGGFWSPYVGMGNNPVMGVDPNGGSVWGTLASAAIGYAVGYTVAYFAGAENPWAWGIAGAVAGGFGGYKAGQFLHNSKSTALQKFMDNHNKLGNLYDRYWNGTVINKAVSEPQCYYVAKGGNHVKKSYYVKIKDFVENPINKSLPSYLAKSREFNSMKDRITYLPTIVDNMRAHYIGDYDIIRSGLEYIHLDENAAFNIFNNGEFVKTNIGSGQNFGLTYSRLPNIQGNSRMTTVLNPCIGYKPNSMYQFNYKLQIKF